MTDPLNKIRNAMPSWGVDAVLIPHEDSYLNEYPPLWAEALAWASGFTGSAGLAVVTKDKAALFTDARYTIQAKKELSKDWESFLSSETKPEEWLAGKATRIGYDPSCLSASRLESLKKALGEKGVEAVPLARNAIHDLMGQKTNAHDLKVEIFPAKYEGRGMDEKLALVRAEMDRLDLAGALIADPTMLSWLLGIRGTVVELTPVALAKGLVTKDEMLVQLDPAHQKPRIKGVTFVDSLNREVAGRLGYNPATTPAALVEEQKNAKPIKNLFEALRVAKTEKSRKVIKAALRRDNKILDQFFTELIEILKTKSLYEHEVAELIAQARSKHPLYVGESFNAIVGWKENGAIIHYRPQKGSDVLIKGDGVLLIDCGAQYKDATTDRTTTLLIGDVGEEARRAYAAVAKSHQTLAKATFPKNTTGAQLDGLCRAPLWAAGFDCPHGIGHGVGQFLSVHEGPFGISARSHDPLPEGLLVSNEPGVYKEGEWGIRHERLYFVEDAGNGMLKFKA